MYGHHQEYVFLLKLFHCASNCISHFNAMLILSHCLFLTTNITYNIYKCGIRYAAFGRLDVGASCIVICCSYRCWCSVNAGVSCVLWWRVDITTLLLVMLLSCPSVWSLWGMVVLSKERGGGCACARVRVCACARVRLCACVRACVCEMLSVVEFI
jgi:hypothetical protein